MIKVNFIEPNTSEWNSWKARCAAATQTLINDYRPGTKPALSDTLYKEQKHVYKGKDGPFCGKCVYCESPLGTHDDLDHFRPKAEVRDLNNELVKVTAPGGSRIPHPGYYWLANDHRNLLPACKDCDSYVNDPAYGPPHGKGNRFPVQNDDYATDPGEENKEAVLIINPTSDDPERHLRFDLATGQLLYTSEKGCVTIDFFGLNIREDLVKRRLETYQSVKAAFAKFLLYPPKFDDWNNQRQYFESSKQEWGIAAREAIREISQYLS